MKKSDYRYTNPEWSIRDLKEKRHLKRVIYALIFTSFAFISVFSLNGNNIYPPLFVTLTLFVLFIMFPFYLLISDNRNFILHDIFYTQLLKIKIVTIDDNLSLFTPVTQELEKIIIGRNGNQKGSSHKKENEELPLKNKISFFWIRKNKKEKLDEEVRERTFRPFLHLIMILFALKEKRFKFISVIGVYFTLVGVFYISLVLLFMEKIVNIYDLSDTSSALILILFLFFWYLLTIYSILQMVSLNNYMYFINEEVRRPYLRKKVKLGENYQQVLDFFQEESAVYIYDYDLDKFQLIDSKYFRKNLPKMRKLVEKSVGTLLTVLISVVFMVFLEISTNVVFVGEPKIHQKSIDKIVEGVKE